MLGVRDDHQVGSPVRVVENPLKQAAPGHRHDAAIVRVGGEAEAERPSKREEEKGEDERRVGCEHHRRSRAPEQAHGGGARAKLPANAPSREIELVERHTQLPGHRAISRLHLPRDPDGASAVCPAHWALDPSDSASRSHDGEYGVATFEITQRYLPDGSGGMSETSCTSIATPSPSRARSPPMSSDCC